MVKQYKLENMSSDLVLPASIRYPELCAYQISSIPRKVSKLLQPFPKNSSAFTHDRIFARPLFFYLNPTDSLQSHTFHDRQHTTYANLRNTKSGRG